MLASFIAAHVYERVLGDQAVPACLKFTATTASISFCADRKLDQTLLKSAAHMKRFFRIR